MAAAEAAVDGSSEGSEVPAAMVHENDYVASELEGGSFREEARVC